MAGDGGGETASTISTVTRGVVEIAYATRLPLAGECGGNRAGHLNDELELR
jgi:hypothetical protein